MRIKTSKDSIASLTDACIKLKEVRHLILNLYFTKGGKITNDYFIRKKQNTVTLDAVQSKPHNILSRMWRSHRYYRKISLGYLVESLTWIYFQKIGKGRCKQ